MTRRLFLHIGMMKSGTTYLQNVCDRNVNALRKGGLLWLGGSAEQQTAAVTEFRGGDRVMAGDEGAWDALRRELRRHDGDALLSHELLPGLAPHRIAPFVQALPAGETIVIVTVRDLSRVIPSRWQETTQNRSAIGWPAYLDAVCDGGPGDRAHRDFWLQADVGRALRIWSEVVPPERMRLITVPRPGASPDELWRRFASVIDVDPKIGARTRNPENASLGAVSTELMLRMNPRVDDLEWPSYRMGFKAGMAKRGLAKRAASEPKLTLPSERWQWVEERTDRMIEEIKAVGPAVVGDLEELRPLRPRAGSERPSSWSPSDAELLDAAMDGLESLGRQLAQAQLALRKERATGRSRSERRVMTWARRRRKSAQRRARGLSPRAVARRVPFARRVARSRPVAVLRGQSRRANRAS